MKKICLFLVWVCCSNVYSQNTIPLTQPIITPVSPEAAAIQKYNSYPVDYSTGIPNISIPLYEIKVGDIILPIILTYHSSGFKPKELSGRVGHGWTLNAEPSVMRTVRGYPDDMCTDGGIGYLHLRNYDYQNIIPTNLSDLDKKKFIRDIVDGKNDGEPDQFCYTLANSKNGTAYFGAYGSYVGGRLVNYPRQDHEVVGYCHHKFYNPNLYLFEIKDENGLKHTFGKNKTSREYTGDCITRWMCDSIVSPRTGAKMWFTYNQNPEEINLSYFLNLKDMVIIEDDFNYKRAATTTLTRKNSSSNYTYKINSDGEIIYNSSQPSLNYTSPSPYRSEYIRRTQIEKIDFDNGYAKFSYSGENLTVLEIKDKLGYLIRKIEFFISRYNDLEKTRATKLDSIRISSSGVEDRIYRFEYYNPYMVPSPETKNIDHWGFANGMDGSVGTAVPHIKEVKSIVDKGNGVKVEVTNPIEGRNRESDPDFAQNGVLKKNNTSGRR